jgi:hypothetical protein
MGKTKEQFEKMQEESVLSHHLQGDEDFQYEMWKEQELKREQDEMERFFLNFNYQIQE